MRCHAFSVIAREHDDRVFLETGLLQSGQQAPDLHVHQMRQPVIFCQIGLPPLHRPIRRGHVLLSVVIAQPGGLDKLGFLGITPEIGRQFRQWTRWNRCVAIHDPVADVMRIAQCHTQTERPIVGSSKKLDRCIGDRFVRGRAKIASWEAVERIW